MKTIKIIILSLFSIGMLGSCNRNIDTEKYQSKRNNVVDVRAMVKEIPMEDDVLIGSYARPFLLNDYLIVGDYRSVDKQIHIFNKNTFEYLGSTANIGQGPDEITVMGNIGTDEKRGMFYVSDHGKMKIFAYDIDSVLADSNYKPHVKVEMDMKQFPDRYLYYSDTLSLALLIKPTSVSSFEQCVAKWNMQDETFEPMPYEHPDIERKRVSITASPQLNRYVECYTHHDLMTICDMNGNLMYNIYGPRWNSKMSNKKYYYGGVVFCADKLVASYSGKENFSNDYEPTELLIFSATGDYLKTLNVGRKIVDFCYDQDNNRLIMNLNDEYQFAYLNLEGLI